MTSVTYIVSSFFVVVEGSGGGVGGFVVENENSASVVSFSAFNYLTVHVPVAPSNLF